MKFFNKLKSVIDRYPATAFGLVFFGCMYLAFVLHYVEYYGAVRQPLVDAFFDCLIIVLPFFLTPKRLVWVVAPSVVVTLEVMTLYFRNFQTLPVISLLYSGAFNEYTFRGALSVFRYSDLIAILLPLLIMIVAWFAIGGRKICGQKFSHRSKLAVLLILVLSPIVRVGVGYISLLYLAHKLVRCHQCRACR